MAEQNNTKEEKKEDEKSSKPKFVFNATYCTERKCVQCGYRCH